MADKLSAREPSATNAPSWAGAISTLTETATLRNLAQDASLWDLTEKHAKEMAAQMSSQHAKTEAESADRAQQYISLIDNERTRLMIEKGRVELQREHNAGQKSILRART